MKCKTYMSMYVKPQEVILSEGLFAVFRQTTGKHDHSQRRDETHTKKIFAWPFYFASVWKIRDKVNTATTKPKCLCQGMCNDLLFHTVWRSGRLHRSKLSCSCQPSKTLIALLQCLSFPKETVKWDRELDSNRTNDVVGLQRALFVESSFFS